MFRSHTDVMIPAKRENKDEMTSSLYVCNFCADGWGSETEVELHRADSHRDTVANLFRSTTKHVCKMCITEFDNEDSVIRHIKSEHLLSSETAIRVEREIFICETCGEMYFNKLLLAHHIAYLHTHRKKNGKYKYKCPNCSKMVHLANSWYHFRGHKLQSVAACKICCFRYKDRNQLAEHLKSHPRYYKCELCGYDTKKEENFNSHIHSVHKTIAKDSIKSGADWKKLYMPRNYPILWKYHNLMGSRGVKLTNNVHICILCREICLDVDSMINHMLVEHVDKEATVTNYTCGCGMSFTNKVLLKHHLFKFKDLHNA